MSENTKDRIQDDVKDAMRARDRERLGVLRLITAAIKQREVDSRQDADEPAVLEVLDKMVKQRRDAEAQYRDAGREDLADQEAYEISVIAHYLPAALGEDELADLIAQAISDAGASSMKDMGKVMGMLKPQLQGRADMAKVSALVKTRLSGG